jgi:hypothetical protein
MQVATQRKGFGNRLKSMFGRKSKEGGKYELSCVESQTRQLADLCYLMQDYTSAIENYQLCFADYKQDNLVKQLASASEMAAQAMVLGALAAAGVMSGASGGYMGVSSADGPVLPAGAMSNFLASQPRREIEACWDEAFACYMRTSMSLASLV